jgi:hypothetical protein
MISGEDSFDQTILFDNMSDLINVVFTDGDGKISLLPENELFKKQMLRVKGWYDAGLVYKDSLITEEHVDTLMKGGVTFSSIQTSEIGVENAKREATGYELVVVEIATNVLSSNFINKSEPAFRLQPTSRKPRLPGSTSFIPILEWKISWFGVKRVLTMLSITARPIIRPILTQSLSASTKPTLFTATSLMLIHGKATVLISVSALWTL